MSSIDLRLINENFNRLYEGVDMSSQPLPEDEQLKKSLEEALVDCGDYASDYTKENALVGAIKTHYPDQEWWEVCKVDIPTCVYTIHNPEELVATITEGILGKEEELLNEDDVESAEVELEEAISPEDQEDSDTIRTIMNKSEVRANAKLTPEEKATMDKLGLKRSFGKLYATDSNGEGAYNISQSDDWGRNGTHGKINYADRARKIGDRAKLNRGINTSAINRHGYFNSPNAYNKAEARELEYEMNNNRDNLKYALSSKKYHKKHMDNAEADYQQAMDAAKRAYDIAVAGAEKRKEDATTGYHKKNYDSANDTINRILKRGPKVEESLNESTYRGVPGTKFISHGHSADPEISVKHGDKTYIANYWDVEDSMYTYYKEDKEYAKSHEDKYAKELKSRYTFDDSDEDFNKFLKDHSDSVVDDIISMGKVEESLKEDIKIYRESDLTDFEFWSGAKDRVKYLTDEDLRQISYILEDSYPEGMTETEVNDIFWFEDDWIAEMLGYENFEELMEARESDEE